MGNSLSGELTNKILNIIPFYSQLNKFRYIVILITLTVQILFRVKDSTNVVVFLFEIRNVRRL